VPGERTERSSNWCGSDAWTNKPSSKTRRQAVEKNILTTGGSQRSHSKCYLWKAIGHVVKQFGRAIFFISVTLDLAVLSIVITFGDDVSLNVPSGIFDPLDNTFLG
jgi:hypothetical protein